MWNWLLDCYNEGSLTLEELEAVMTDEEAARALWEDWSDDSSDFVSYVRDEVWPVIAHLKKKEKDETKS